MHAATGTVLFITYIPCSTQLHMHMQHTAQHPPPPPAQRQSLHRRTCSSTISVCALAIAICDTVLLFHAGPSNFSGAPAPPLAACSVAAPDTARRAARCRSAASASAADTTKQQRRRVASWYWQIQRVEV